MATKNYINVKLSNGSTIEAYRESKKDYTSEIRAKIVTKTDNKTVVTYKTWFANTTDCRLAQANGLLAIIDDARHTWYLIVDSNKKSEVAREVRQSVDDEMKRIQRKARVAHKCGVGTMVTRKENQGKGYDWLNKERV